MKNKNICKFPAARFEADSLSVFCFVKETDAAVMQKKTVLRTDRILLCLEGSGTAVLDGTPYPVRGGTLLFAFSGEELSAEGSEDLCYIYIDFGGSRADELLRRFDITPLSRIREGQDGLIPLWQESLYRASDKTIDLAAESLLLLSLSRLDTVGGEGGLVGEIVRITEESFHDPTLGIGPIAAALSYHPKYLSHLFKQRTGVGYSEYLRSVRLKYAITLFDRGIDSVKNVALLSGFSDPLYFSSVFKKSIGMSPREYIAARVGGEAQKGKKDTKDT